MSLSSTRILKVIVVTDDVEKTASAYRALLGTERQPEPGKERRNLREPFIRYLGRPIDGTPMKNVSVLTENFWFEIIQPLEEDGPWAAWLREHGTSICAVSLLSDGPLENDEATMEKAGFPLLFKQEKGYEAYDYFDTASTLGVLLEMKEQY